MNAENYSCYKHKAHQMILELNGRFHVRAAVVNSLQYLFSDVYVLQGV